MKYLLLPLLFMLSFISNAQYFSDDFLRADLDKSRFLFADWDKVASEKEQIIMLKSWGIGSIAHQSAEDTSTYDFVIFPAKYTAKIKYKGVAVCRFVDYQKFQNEEREACMITPDMPVLSMMMLPDDVVIPNAEIKLVLGLKNSLSLHLRNPLEKAIQGKPGFISFKKSVNKTVPFVHPFALNSSLRDLNSNTFAELHAIAPQRVKYEKRGQGSVKEEGVLVYNLPLPRSWTDSSFQICIFHIDLGVFYSEACPKTKELGRMGEKELLQLLDALYSVEVISLFSSKR